MARIMFTALAVVAGLTLGSTALAQRASFYQCDGCTAADMRETAMVIGNGDHHLYNVQTRTLKRYTVRGGSQPLAVIGPDGRRGARTTEKPSVESTQRAPAAAQATYGGQTIVQEQIPDSRVVAIFQDMIALDAQYPGVFNSLSSVEVPLETVGSYVDGSSYRPYSPAGVALARPVGSFPGSGEFNSFMDALRAALTRADAGLGGQLSGLLGIGNRINGVSIQTPAGGAGLSWDNFTTPTFLSLCNSSGACIVVKIDPATKQIEFVRAHDRFNNDYPPRNANGTGFELPFPSPPFADEYANDLAARGVRVSRETRGNGPRLRTSVVCMYVNGILDGCTVIVERF